MLQFVEHVADRHYLEMNLGEATVSDRSKLGGTIGSARLRSDHGVIVVAVKRNETMLFTPGPSEELRPGDVLVLMGREEDLKKTEGLLRGAPSPEVARPNRTLKSSTSSRRRKSSP